MPAAPPATDYFSLFGLPRKLNLDMADLEQRYRALSRQCHPDYFYNAPPAERLSSLERSSYLNDAYRTLRDPAARIAYLLKIEGAAWERDAGAPVPAALLDEVFALNEELDRIRTIRENGAAPGEWRPRVEQARGPIEAKRADYEAQLHQLMIEWDRVVDQSRSDPARRRLLQALRERTLEQNYIRNLLAGIERALNA
jgi:molecular chaperone HscB